MHRACNFSFTVKIGRFVNDPVSAGHSSLGPTTFLNSCQVSSGATLGIEVNCRCSLLLRLASMHRVQVGLQLYRLLWLLQLGGLSRTEHMLSAVATTRE